MSGRTHLVSAVAVGALAAAGLVVGATTATAAGPARASSCGNAALAVTRTFVDGAAGHSYLTLIYRNTTTHTCTVFGYPGLDAVSKKGTVIAHAARTRNGTPLRTVRIRPGKYASADVQWLNFNGQTGGSCRHGRFVDTIVAGTSRVHRLRVAASACELQVHPTVAGVPQFPHYAPAQRDWLVGSKVDAADQGRYFRRAEDQLKLGKHYPQQVKTLAQLRSFPDTGLTRKQRKQVRADVRLLNTFFGTPGRYL